MAKDPAALFYIDKWLVATKEMKADCRGWFLNLILHQFDKGDLPNSMEELANLADVRISEYDRFKEVFEQVLKHKFKQNTNGRLENDYAKEIMQARELFKEKRGDAGKMSYVVRYIRKNLSQDENLIFFFKKNANLSEINIKDEQMIKQVFKQTSELYINVNKNVIVNNNEDKEGGSGETEKYIHVDGEKIHLENLNEWFNGEFFVQKENWQRLYPKANINDALVSFGLEKCYDTFKDISHFKNSFNLKLKSIHDKNGAKNWTNGTGKGLTPADAKPSGGSFGSL